MALDLVRLARRESGAMILGRVVKVASWERILWLAVAHALSVMEEPFVQPNRHRWLCALSASMLALDRRNVLFVVPNRNTRMNLVRVTARNVR